MTTTSKHKHILYEYSMTDDAIILGPRAAAEAAIQIIQKCFKTGEATFLEDCSADDPLVFLGNAMWIEFKWLRACFFTMYLRSAHVICTAFPEANTHARATQNVHCNPTFLGGNA